MSYFANRPSDELATAVLNKAEGWYSNLEANGYLDKVRECWEAYHGVYNSSFNESHTITFEGEQGELVRLNVNHLRNIGKNIVNMITSTRPALEARAVNSDPKSSIQAVLANNLLDYYLREKRLEKYIRRAAEYGVALGAGYVLLEWNATSGDVYEIDEDTGDKFYPGDIEFSNLSPFDVVVDSTKEVFEDLDWIIIRRFKNKYDLAAKYPEYKEKIEGMETKSDIFNYRFLGNTISSTYEETDDIPVYEFYHRNSEAVPEGRYTMFLDSDVVLIDTDNPYDEIPVFRMAPDEILGTPLGYSPLFDLLPLQSAVNSMYSTALTNNNAFGVQNVFVERGADLSYEALPGGLNIMEGNSKPEPINLTNTAPETYNFMQQLVRDMEIISGVNSVARGNPEASLKSGSALAMVQSMALQFMSNFQQGYVAALEDIGTSTVKMLRRFATTPRIATIAGNANKPYMKEFTGEDLKDVTRVIVDVANPLSNTYAGRMQMADNLLQYGDKKLTPSEYIMLLKTGSLEHLTEDTFKNEINIKNENEALIRGEYVPVLVVDDHVEHILKHREVANDPAARMDPVRMKALNAHLEEHINFMKNGDPVLLEILGIPPIGQPPQQVPQAPLDPNQPAPSPDQIPIDQVTGPGIPEGANVPNLPNLPKLPDQ